jgi:hypothetical protein
VSEGCQLEIPDSFTALYVQRPYGRLRAPRAEILERYQLCEDLAQLVTETAFTMLHQLGITEVQVLERCYRGMLGDSAIVRPQEAQWVVQRLAELCNWDVAVDVWPRVFEC